MVTDPDIHASAAHRNMAEHLTAPLQGGAQESELTVSIAGTIDVTVPTREPIVLAAPLHSLDGSALSLSVEAPGGATTTLDFTAGTEAGAYLALYRPQAALDTGLVAPFALRLKLTRVGPAGSEVLPADQIAQHLAVRLVEGVTGRLLYLLGAEKQRLRRHARTVALARTLDGAFGDALDRIGAELGVPRFFDTIRFEPAPPDERAAQPGSITTEDRREPDEEYRRRLAIYRPWLYPTRRHVTAMLNGPGGPDQPNRGLLGGLGVRQRAAVTETAHPLAAAVHLVAVGSSAVRTGFSEYIRRTILIWPGADAQSDAAHAQRYLPHAMAERVDALRRRLRAGFDIPTAGALAPMLAQALDRVNRCRRALGATTRWPILRGQDVAAGSRYQLGLGADLRMLSAVELQSLADRLRDGNINLPKAPTDLEPDPAETAALLAAASPRSATDDPDGAWLLEAAGLRTVHRIRADVLYVSHIPTFGLTITGSPTAGVGQRVAMEAHYHAAGEPGSHVLLVRGLDAAVRDWTELGHAPWRTLDDAATAWAAAVPTPGATAQLLSEVGLPSVTDTDDIETRLLRLSPELIATIELPPAESGRIRAGRPEALADLRHLLSVLSAQGISSALLLVLPGSVVVVLGGIALPLVGVNLTERAATRFRWYATRIWPADDHRPGHPEIGYLGSRTQFRPAAAGLYAIVSVGQIRSNLIGGDPYEFTIDLPDGTTLDLLQYEYLMNLLAHVHPAGTRVNTWPVRHSHVDIDGDGVAQPVPLESARIFRQYRRQRFRGQRMTGA